MEISWNFVSPKKWEPWSGINNLLLLYHVLWVAIPETLN